MLKCYISKMLYKNLENRKKILFEYLRKNPNATYIQIKRDTKLKVERIFPRSMKDAFIAAGIPLSKSLRKRSRDQMLKEVIEFIGNNPHANTITIKKELGIDIPKTFKRIKEAYKVAGVEYIPNISVGGTALPEIRLRAINFEDEVTNFLGNKGKVIRKVKLKRKKQVDALFYYQTERYVIEVKNYIRKKITFSDIKQTLSYMKELNCKNGLIIHTYPKDEIDVFNLEDYQIKIVPYSKLINEVFDDLLKKESYKN